MSSQREQAIQRFHAERPGATSGALARGDSYTRLAALVAPGSRVLDLACGDGHLSRLLTARGCTVTGVDLSAAELARARALDPTGTYVRARAQQLPFASGSHDTCVCHLGLMLFDGPATVLAEVRRVIGPNGTLHALLGGGPTSDGDDAFHRFLTVARPYLGQRPGTWAPAVPNAPPSGSGVDEVSIAADAERWEVDLGGSFEEVWTFLGSSYQLDPADHAHVRELTRAACADFGAEVPLRVVMFLVTR